MVYRMKGVTRQQLRYSLRQCIRLKTYLAPGGRETSPHSQVSACPPSKYWTPPWTSSLFKLPAVAQTPPVTHARNSEHQLRSRKRAPPLPPPVPAPGAPSSADGQAGPESRSRIERPGEGRAGPTPQRVLTGHGTLHRPRPPPRHVRAPGAAFAVETARGPAAPHASPDPGPAEAAVAPAEGKGRSVTRCRRRRTEGLPPPRSPLAALSLGYDNGWGWGRSLPPFRWENKHTKGPLRQQLALRGKGGQDSAEKTRAGSRSLLSGQPPGLPPAPRLPLGPTGRE